MPSLRLLFLLAASVLPLVAAEPSKPNILFIIADDLATRLSCYGDEAAITPNIDRLAVEGVVFNRAYCQGAVCTPSRTSFMLGLNTRHAKANHFIKHPDTMTLGRWFPSMATKPPPSARSTTTSPTTPSPIPRPGMCA
jgi:hypothetical protein